MTSRKGKGSNPNSHRNKPRLGEGAIAKGVTLAPKQWDVASKLGDGNYSLGIRRLVDLALSIGAIDSEKLFQRLPALDISEKLQYPSMTGFQECDRQFKTSAVSTLK